MQLRSTIHMDSLKNSTEYTYGRSGLKVVRVRPLGLCPSLVSSKLLLMSLFWTCVVVKLGSRNISRVRDRRGRQRRFDQFLSKLRIGFQVHVGVDGAHHEQRAGRIFSHPIGCWPRCPGLLKEPDNARQARLVLTVPYDSFAEFKTVHRHWRRGWTQRHLGGAPGFNRHTGVWSQRWAGSIGAENPSSAFSEQLEDGSY